MKSIRDTENLKANSSKSNVLLLRCKAREAAVPHTILLLKPTAINYFVCVCYL